MNRESSRYPARSRFRFLGDIYQDAQREDRNLLAARRLYQNGDAQELNPERLIRNLEEMQDVHRAQQERIRNLEEENRRLRKQMEQMRQELTSNTSNLTPPQESSSDTTPDADSIPTSEIPIFQDIQSCFQEWSLVSQVLGEALDADVTLEEFTRYEIFRRLMQRSDSPVMLLSHTGEIVGHSEVLVTQYPQWGNCLGQNIEQLLPETNMDLLQNSRDTGLRVRVAEETLCLHPCELGEPDHPVGMLLLPERTLN